MVIDPVARRTDGESVRIAKDVLSAAHTPRSAFRTAPRSSLGPCPGGVRAGPWWSATITHCCARWPSSTANGSWPCGVLSLIPVGAAHALEVAHALGVPRGAVAAARTALDGAVRRLDLLVDDSDGVVLGRLRIPAPAPPPGPGGPHSGVTAVWDTCRSLMTSLVRPAPVAATTHPGTHRLRIEADGVLLSDLDTPVRGISVTSQGGGGLADVVVRTASGEDVTAEAKAVTVSGADFRYRADIQTGGRSAPGPGRSGRVPGG